MRKIYIHHHNQAEERLYDSETIDTVIEMLENQVISKAPIPIGAGLRDSVLDNGFVPRRGILRDELGKYFESSSVIDIDGYATFRMNEHHVKMYGVLCAVISKVTGVR